MLRTDLFARTALDAVGGFTAVERMDIVIECCVPARGNLLCVQRRKVIRDRDLLRTSVRAVPAGCTGDQVHAVKNLLYLCDSSQLRLVQRLEILHVADVILHLLERAHAGEHHQNSGKTGREPNGVACDAAAVEVFQDLLC